LARLPIEGQKQVVDFIAFLQKRYQRSRLRKRSRKLRLAEEAFIGLWKDREDLQDSTQWVRNMRQREWVN
jgi:hypothetical protein